MLRRVPTVIDYIRANSPCATGEIFLGRFDTLRGAWMANDVEPAHMLWAVDAVLARFLGKKRKKESLDLVFKDMDDARYNLRSTSSMWTHHKADETVVAHIVDIIWGSLAGNYMHPLIGMVAMLTELRNFKPVRSRHPTAGDPTRLGKELDKWEDGFRSSMRYHFPDMFISMW